MTSKWIVLKFGGTSVAGKAQWETIAELAQARRSEGFRVVLVCSAVAGVTDRLTALAGCPGSGELRQQLLEIHAGLGQSLEVDESRWRPQAEQRGVVPAQGLVVHVVGVQGARTSDPLLDQLAAPGPRAT